MCPWTACEQHGLRTLDASRTTARLRREPVISARSLGAALFVALLLLLPALSLAQGVWTPLVRRLEADGFDRGRMETLFARPEVRFDPEVMARKMNALLDVKIAGPKPPGEAPELYLSYLNPFLIMQARSFLEAQRPALREARLRYDVPEEILVALFLVETKLGRNIGSRSALTTLASMALAGDFALVAPLIERRDLSPELALWLRWRTAQKSAWAYKELKALLIYAKAAGFDPASIPGSVYGAIGMCQFMPTNAVRYGADLDGDGRVDLFRASDALLSTARFLKANGWAANLSRERQEAVLYRYNHSHPYTRTIMAVADRLRDGDSGFSADGE